MEQPSDARLGGKLLLPRNSLVWMQVRSGEAKGLWIELNPRTGGTFYDGTSELAVQEFIARHLQPNMVFYDLGANCGLFSLIAARRVGPGGRVYSFEPDPELAERLRRNVQRNRFQHCTVVESAVWNRTGTLRFSRSDPSMSLDRGTGHIASPEESSELLSVRTLALDDFARNNEAPNLIKCDVEGAEAQVFEGAERLLASHSPVIVCEIHSESASKAVRNLLEQFRYAISELDGNHIAAERVRN